MHMERADVPVSPTAVPCGAKAVASIAGSAWYGAAQVNSIFPSNRRSSIKGAALPLRCLPLRAVTPNSGQNDH